MRHTSVLLEDVAAVGVEVIVKVLRPNEFDIRTKCVPAEKLVNSEGAPEA